MEAFEAHSALLPCPRKSPSWVGPQYKGSGWSADSSATLFLYGSGLLAARGTSGAIQDGAFLHAVTTEATASKLPISLHTRLRA